LNNPALAAKESSNRIGFKPYSTVQDVPSKQVLDYVNQNKNIEEIKHHPL